MNGLMRIRMFSGGDREDTYSGGYRPEYEGGSRDGYESRYAPMRATYDEGAESRFRDRTGREHYDNGRFAPMRSEYDGGSYNNYAGGYDNADMRDAPRRSWEIIENNDQSRNSERMEPNTERFTEAQYRGEMNQDGMKRVYGFGVVEGGGARSHYRGPDHGDEMAHRRSDMARGYGRSEAVPPMTREMAEEWMDSIRNEDGTRGPHWSIEQVKALMKQKGISGDPMRVWLAMNAEYSDMVAVNKKYGIDKPEYYLDAATARWLNDADAVHDKQAAYYTYVVKH